MKLKNIFLSILAAVAFLTGCTPEELVPTLSEFKVDPSYIGFSSDGGSVTAAVEATESWSFDTATIPAWLTVNPTSGSAGSSNIVFSTAKNETGKALAQEVKVKVGDKVQIFTVKQAAEVAGDLPITSIADVIKAGDGSFRIRGTVTGIANTSYGNFYMADETGSIYIYGVFNAKGQYPKDADGGWASFGIEAGDIVTVEGPYTLYSGTTPELVDATLIKVEKSLITVSPSEIELEAEAGTFDLTVDSKVNGVVPVVESNWIRFQDIAEKNGKLIFTFAYDANTRTATRTATVSFKAPGALKAVNVSQIGVPPTGATITELVAMEDGSVVETLECTTVAKTTKGIVVSDGTTAIYVYGGQVDGVAVGDNLKIWATKTTYNGVPELTTITAIDVISNGNTVKHPDAKDITASALEYAASLAEYVKLSGTLSVSGNYYNMTLDGVDPEVKMGSIVYPVDALDAKAFDGKKITVTGYFNGLSGKGRYINVVATKIAEFVDNPKGTVNNPFAASEVAEMIKSGNTPEGKVYVRGIISQIDNVSWDTTAEKYYGNAQYWISTDGSAADLEIYRGYYLGGDKFDAEGQIKVGDEVVVYGEMTLYGTTPEFKANNYIWTLNGHAKPDGEGTAENPYNVTKIVNMLLGDNTPEGEVYVKGVICQIDNVNLQYGNAQYWLSDDGGRKYMMEVYRGFWFGGEKFTSEDQIQVGDLVVVTGKVKLFVKGETKTPEFDANNKLVSINGKTE